MPRQHTLIAAGGGHFKPYFLLSPFFSEYPEYFLFMNSTEIFIKVHQSNSRFPHKLSYLFGEGVIDGPQGPHLRLVEDHSLSNRLECASMRLYQRLVNQTWDDSPLFHVIAQGGLLNNLYGANTFENIRKRIESIAEEAQPDDRVNLYLLGHSLGPGTLLLWPTSGTFSVLRPADLSPLIEKINPSTPVTLFVWSCQSGVWNELADKHHNLQVLSVTDKYSTHNAWRFEIDSYIREHTKWLDDPEAEFSLIERHARAGIVQPGLDPRTGTDSFSYWLNKMLKGLDPDYREPKDRPRNFDTSYSTVTSYVSKTLDYLESFSEKKQNNPLEEDLLFTRSIEKKIDPSLPCKQEGLKVFEEHREQILRVLIKISEMPARVVNIMSSPYANFDKKVYLFLLGVAVGLIEPNVMREFIERGYYLLDLKSANLENALPRLRAMNTPLLNRVLETGKLSLINPERYQPEALEAGMTIN